MVSAITTLWHLSWRTAATASALAGVASHHIVFRPYEIDGLGWELVFSYLGASMFIFLAFLHAGQYDLAAAVLRTLLISSAYNVGVAISILAYRSYFHRLGNFPGPFGARLSRFYAFNKVAKTVKGCEDVRQLHDQYGDFVRIGTASITKYKQQQA